jgi:hypothetical protein
MCLRFRLTALFLLLTTTLFAQEVLRLNITTMPLRCADDGTGVIVLSGTGGVPPYLYSINAQPFGEQRIFRNLQGGTYRVRVRDTRGSEVTQNATVFSPEPLRWNLNARIIKQPSGCNQYDARIVAPATGGMPELTYTLNGRFANKTGTFDNLPGGMYVLRVTDTNGCFIEDSIRLIDPALNIAIRTTVLNEPLCAGESVGSFEVSASGGVPPYQYSLDGLEYQSQNRFDNLRGGYIYQVFVKGANDCFNTADVLIREPLPLTVDVTVKNPQCDAPDGRLTFRVTGGVKPYRYSIDGGQTFVPDSVFNQLSYGPYAWTVRDANNCTFSNRSILQKTIDFPVKVTAINPACNLAQNGSIRVEVTDGEGPYEYSIDGLTFVKKNVFDSLRAGRYVITIRNVNDCTDTVMVTLREQNDLAFEADIRYPDCIGNGGDAGNGIITIKGKGGKRPYRYSTDGINFQADSVFRNRTATPTWVYILDANNCFVSKYFNIYPQANNINVSFETKPPTCAGAFNGSIKVTASGGNAPYLYNLNSGQWQSGSEFSSLGSDRYVVGIMDRNECATFRTVELFSPMALEVTATIQNVTCLGRNDGSIIMNVTGGTPPYRYTMVKPTRSQLEPTFDNLDAGDYEIIVTDANGCEVRSDIEVAAPEVRITVKQPSCAGNDGRIEIQVLNYDGTRTYVMNGDSSLTKNVYESLGAGTYRVRVVLDNNCIVGDNIILSAQTNINVAVEGVAVTACGSADGQLIVNVSGGKSPIVYSLDKVNFQFSNTFRNLAQGDYTVYVRDASGCLIEKQATVPGSRDSLRFSFLASNVSCPGGRNGSVLLNILNGTPPIRVLWSNGATTNDLTNVPAGTYTVSLTDAKGCTGLGRITISQPDSFKLSLEIKDTKPDQKTGEITVSVTGGTPPYLYFLNGSEPTTNNRFRDLDKGIYTVRVRDASGCDTATTAEVKTLIGLGEAVGKSGFSVYPNPARETVSIRLSASVTGKVMLRLTDLSGRVVKETSLDSEEGMLSLSGVSAGCYLLTLISAEGQQTVKLMAE